MANQPIMVLVPDDRVRSWALTAAEALRTQLDGVDLLRPGQGVCASPQPWFEALERRLFGPPSSGHTDWASTGSLPVLDLGSCEERIIVVNLTGHAPEELPACLASAAVLSPLFEGQYRPEGIVSPLLAGDTPHLATVLTVRQKARLLHGARIAIHDRHVMIRALDTVLARTVELMVAATLHLHSHKPLPAAIQAPPKARGEFGSRTAVRQVFRAYAPLIWNKLTAPVVRRDDWCIGLRAAPAGSAPPDLDLSPASFKLIESPPDRFFADPILIRHDGCTALFFEDYDYTTRRGRISYVTVSDSGDHGEPAVALSRPCHLSYPFMFDHEGAALMVPETSTNRTVELYEATAFPDGWRLRAVLMDDIEASDATLHFDAGAGLWWMFATVTAFGSLAHDTLSLFFSGRLNGPWRAHPMNPVKCDRSSSRPAGPLVSANGRLLRPAQDCTNGYGSALAWCEIKELTPTTFREEIVARQSPQAPFFGLHTYSRCGGFETVDFKRNRLRLRQGWSRSGKSNFSGTVQDTE
ncbi:MAG: hypothetical protein HC829_00100 [Bacteroidales bacterium]|nr:hypothetical protein [Bacteroidales bacterium]